MVPLVSAPLALARYSSYIFIKSLIQNQTKLEFDFKDPVLFIDGFDRQTFQPSDFLAALVFRIFSLLNK